MHTRPGALNAAGSAGDGGFDGARTDLLSFSLCSEARGFSVLRLRALGPRCLSTQLRVGRARGTLKSLLTGIILMIF